MGKTAFFNENEKGVVIAIKVIPSTSKNAFDRIITDSPDGHYLKLRVTAPLEKGKANKAVCRLLGKLWNIAPSSIEVISHATSRQKRLQIYGDSHALITMLTE